MEMKNKFKTGIQSKILQLTTCYLLLAVIVALLAAGAYYRNEVWKSNLSLQADAAAKSPNKDRTRNNFAVELIKAGRYEEAKYELEETLRINPKSVEARNNLSAVLMAQGDYKGAARYLFEASRIDPDSPSIQNNLGTLLCRQGQYSEALHHYKEALRLKPDFTEARKNYETVATALKGK